MATTNGVNDVNGVNGVSGTHKSAHVSVDEFVRQSYDYLICGGGTAGLVIAARLTENSDVTVGVIEAGKNRLGDPLVDVPALFLQMLGNKEYDWAWDSIPQVREPTTGICTLSDLHYSQETTTKCIKWLVARHWAGRAR